MKVITLLEKELTVEIDPALCPFCDNLCEGADPDVVLLKIRCVGGPVLSLAHFTCVPTACLSQGALG